MIDPTDTLCGHTFCNKCLFDSYLQKRRCPVCRSTTNSRLDFKNKSLKALIPKFVSKYESMTKEYEDRMKKNEEWLFVKRPQQLAEGSLLDVRDTENVWCEGKIMEIFKNKKHADTYKIHYPGWSTVYDEFICSNSDRLASHGLFTSRTGKLRRYTKL